jgi:phage baseplate assembly protein W
MADTDTLLRGLAFPFRRDATDFATAEGAAQVIQNVANVLATPRGTHPWRPDFGSDLHRLIHSNSVAATAIAQQFVARALERWVPTVRLQRVSVSVAAGLLRVSVTYRIVKGIAASADVISQTLTIQA